MTITRSHWTSGGYAAHTTPNTTDLSDKIKIVRREQLRCRDEYLKTTDPVERAGALLGMHDQWAEEYLILYGEENGRHK